MKSSSNPNKIKIVIGLFFIFLGILTSKFVLEKFISPYAIIELSFRLPIGLINIGFVLLGILCFFLDFEKISLKKAIDFYKYISITMVSAVILFIVLNVGLYAITLFKDAAYYRDQIFLGYKQRLEPLYSNLEKSEISKLLYETWSRPYIYEPYTQFKERPVMGHYVNVSENGFRLIKNQGPWPPNPNNFNVFLFGGSTTFGYGVPDGETIASYLQELCSNQNLRKGIFVYNFGRGHYFSSQERILFEKLITSGFVPNLAIFIDGLNDFYYYNDEPLFTQNLKRFIEDKGTNLLNLPLLSAVKNVRKARESEETLKGAKKNGNFEEDEYNNIPQIKTVVERYLKNKTIVELIGKNFNVETVFIWQPVPTYKYDLKYHIFAGKGFGRFLSSKYGYKFMEEYVKKHNLGTHFLWLADIQQDMKKPLYIDIDHYSPEMSSEIAKYIYNFLISKNLFYVK